MFQRKASEMRGIGRRFSLALAGAITAPLCASLTADDDMSRTSRWLLSTPEPAAIAAVDNARLEISLQRGIDFLLHDQNSDGSWGSAARTKGLNIYAPVPGAHQAFRAAVTALCLSALIEAGDQRPEVRQAIERGRVAPARRC